MHEATDRDAGGEHQHDDQAGHDAGLPQLIH
jgi:hypothetical protein